MSTWRTDGHSLQRDYMDNAAADHLNKLVTEVGDGIDVILHELVKLRRESLDLRARHRLKRAETAAQRIAAIIRQAAAGVAGTPSVGADTVDEPSSPDR